VIAVHADNEFTDVQEIQYNLFLIRKRPYSGRLNDHRELPPFGVATILRQEGIGLAQRIGVNRTGFSGDLFV
jgi:hypothetical protein